MEQQQLRVFLLAGFRAEVGGQTVVETAWQRPAAKRLVKLLALTPAHRLQRDQVLDVLWPDLAPDAALHELRKALSLARRALQPGGNRASSIYLQYSDDTLSLSPSVWVDTDVFETMARTVRRQSDLDGLHKALEAYAGPVLPEDLYEDWAQARREQLEHLEVHLRQELAERLAACGQTLQASEQLEQVLMRDPTREETHRLLMRLYDSAGQRDRALKQYEACHAALRRELEAEPEEETTRLYQRIRGTVRPPQREQLLPAPIRRRPSVPLVGRDYPRDLLTNTLQRVTSGHGEIVLVGGEAGVGKSRLVADAARAAAQGGTPVLWGAGYQQQGAIPYGPFVEALRGYLIGCTDEVRGRLGESYQELTPLIPELLDTASGHLVTGAEVGIERGQLFTSLIRLLDEVAGQSPLLLVLDDLHDADSGTLQLLEHLARFLPDHCWLIVGTYRQEEAPPGSELGRLIGRLNRDELCRSLLLLRLSRVDCDQLTETLLPGPAEEDLLEHLYRLSLGNPLFLGELINAGRDSTSFVREEDRWRLRAGASTPVPDGVREVISARAGSLDAATRQLVRVAAVHGMDSPVWLLENASRLDRDQFLDALETATASRLLEEREHSYAFSHPLFRDAIYQDMSTHRRIHLHGVLGDALERVAPLDVTTLAYHYGLSDNRAQSAFYQELAGDRVGEVDAHRLAASHYRHALRDLAAADRPHDEARLREKLGGDLRALGEYDEALAALAMAGAVYREQGDLDGAARAVATMGAVHASRATPREGLALVQAMWDELGDSLQPDARATLLVCVARLWATCGQYPDSLQSASQAEQLVQQTGNVVLLGEAKARIGAAQVVTGDLVEGMQTLQEALPLVEAANDLEHQGLVLAGIAYAQLKQGDPRAARATRLRSLAVRERRGEAALIAEELHNLANVEVTLGDWKTARRRLERALEVVATTRAPLNARGALLHLGVIASFEGGWEDAEQYLDRALAMAREAGDRKMEDHVTRAWSGVARGRNQPLQAIERLEPLASPVRPGSTDVAYVRAELARSWVEAGDASRGMDALRPEVEKAGNAPDTYVSLVIFQEYGRVLTALDRFDEAEHFLRQALGLARRQHATFNFAVCLDLLGRVLQRQGLPEEARRRLETARKIFTSLGARPYLDRTIAALSELC